MTRIYNIIIIKNIFLLIFSLFFFLSSSFQQSILIPVPFNNPIYPPLTLSRIYDELFEEKFQHFQQVNQIHAEHNYDYEGKSNNTRQTRKGRRGRKKGIFKYPTTNEYRHGSLALSVHFSPREIGPVEGGETAPLFPPSITVFARSQGLSRFSWAKNTGVPVPPRDGNVCITARFLRNFLAGRHEPLGAAAPGKDRVTLQICRNAPR